MSPNSNRKEGPEYRSPVLWPLEGNTHHLLLFSSSPLFFALVFFLSALPPGQSVHLLLLPPPPSSPTSVTFFWAPNQGEGGGKRDKWCGPLLSGGGKETFLGFNYRVIFLPFLPSLPRFVFCFYFSSSSLFRAHIVTHKQRRRILTRPCESGKVFQLEEELGKGSPDVRPNGIAQAESVMAWKSPNTNLTLVISTHV